MKPITVNQLKKYCEEEIKNGNGNNAIMISDDDEGNGYHYLWYSFIKANKMLDDMKNLNLPENFIMIDGLDENIAKKEDTIILG